jgi:hypothetical protein
VRRVFRAWFKSFKPFNGLKRLERMELFERLEPFTGSPIIYVMKPYSFPAFWQTILCRTSAGR